MTSNSPYLQIKRRLVCSMQKRPKKMHAVGSVARTRVPSLQYSRLAWDVAVAYMRGKAGSTFTAAQKTTAGCSFFGFLLFVVLTLPRISAIISLPVLATSARDWEWRERESSATSISRPARFPTKDYWSRETTTSLDFRAMP